MNLLNLLIGFVAGVAATTLIEFVAYRTLRRRGTVVVCHEH